MMSNTLDNISISRTRDDVIDALEDMGYDSRQFNSKDIQSILAMLYDNIQEHADNEVKYLIDVYLDNNQDLKERIS